MKRLRGMSCIRQVDLRPCEEIIKAPSSSPNENLSSRSPGDLDDVTQNTYLSNSYVDRFNFKLQVEKFIAAELINQ
jgi:hypothetical protein